jgi:hypothetical protein
MRVQKSAIGGLAGFVLALACTAVPAQAVDDGARAIGPGTIVVETALGGFILGYDIDPEGTEGILSEAATLPDGRSNVAVETFDQRTGAIIRIIKQQDDTKSDYATLGILGNHVALTEFEHVKTMFVDRRTYLVSNPVDANRFTGRWTPPFGAVEDIITGTSSALGSANAAFLGMHNVVNDFASYVFVSNVGSNTSGPVFAIGDPIFNWSNSPVMAYDAKNNRAVLGGSRGCYGCPTTIATVDLGTGALSKFTGRGRGFVNGIAFDSTTGIACTTTEDDFSVEFYDLVNGTSRIVQLPGATNQLQSGGAVAVDPMHGLFLVGQEFSSTAPALGSSIQVFDEQGNFVESLNGFSLPASPAYMALNPGQRSGFVIVTPALSSLQSFTY